jgi:hypothetical protein
MAHQSGGGGWSTSAKRDLAGYPVKAIIVFLLLLGGLLLIRYLLPDRVFQDMQWLVALALIPVLPWLLAWARRLFSSLKLGPIEMTFLPPDPIASQVDDLASSIAELAVDSEGEVRPAGEIAGYMTSYSSAIVESTRDIATSRATVLPVDLGSGDKWLLPNLYFLAFLLESRTRLDVMIFTERSGAAQRYLIGSCTPSALRERLEAKIPALGEARKKTSVDNLSQAGFEFFKTLKDQLHTLNLANEPPQWINAQLLAALLGPDLCDDRVLERDLRSKTALADVLAARLRYVPVVERDEFVGIIDKNECALKVARAAVSDSDVLTP